MVDENSPNLIDHNSIPVESSNAVHNVAEISSVEQSKLVAATIPKEVAQDCKKAAARELRYIDSFVQRGDPTLTQDTGACDMVVFHQLFKRMSEG